jgi:hypothetical protein
MFIRLLALLCSLTFVFGQTIPLVRVVDAKTSKPLAGVEVGCITRGGGIKVLLLYADSLGCIDLARHPQGTTYDFYYSGYHSLHLTIEEIHAAGYVVKLEPHRKGILRWLCG